MYHASPGPGSLVHIICGNGGILSVYSIEFFITHYHCLCCCSFIAIIITIRDIHRAVCYLMLSNVRRLDSVSVLKWNPCSWVKYMELFSVSGLETECRLRNIRFEVIGSSETSILTRETIRNVPEDCILPSPKRCALNNEDDCG
jgi:hypothetical protein